MSEERFDKAQEESLPELGGTYATQDGNAVKMVGIANEGTHNETLVDMAGVHRYSRRLADMGRVTGTAHDYSHPGNLARPIHAIKLEHPSRATNTRSDDGMVAHPDKSGDLYVCIADGEGTHETRVVRGYEGVAAFYEEMCGKDADDTLDSLKRTWDDPEEWANGRTKLHLELYCATFTVYGISPAELERSGLAFSATAFTREEAAKVVERKANGLRDEYCHGDSGPDGYTWTNKEAEWQVILLDELAEELRRGS